MSFEKSWIYFCQIFFLKNKIITKNTDPNEKGPIISLTRYKNNARYFNIIKIQVRKDLFHSEADFNQLSYNIKIKNTQSFQRSKNIKIFYDFDDQEKVNYLNFNSIFHSNFSGIK